MKHKIINLKNLIFFSLILVFSLGLASCKSHKKSKVEQPVYVGEVVETKLKGKQKKKKTVGEQIVEESLTWVGTPYGYGKNEKGVATDCSGLVVTVYEKVAGIKLPRNSAEQAEWCEELKEKHVSPGDLVFFATGKDKHKVSHVGIMMDKEQFVHSSGTKGVIISEMTTPYYQRTFIKFGRVPGFEE